MHERLANYARQEFARRTGGHLCDLQIEYVDGDVFMIGCPEHGYALMPFQPTGRQKRRIRRNDARHA